MRGRQGWRLSDLAGYAGLDKGTTHRMLAALARERLVQQRAADHHYLAGPLIYELGYAVPQHGAFVQACRPQLQQIARRTRTVAFMYLRSGNDFVCVLREGRAEVKALTIELGTRRPLLVSAGGVAMLVAMERAERQAIVAENLQRLQHFDAARRRGLKAMLRRSEQHGCGFNLEDVVPRINACAVAVRDAAGRPIGSLCVTGPAQSHPPQRLRDIVALLREEVAAIEARAADMLAG